MAPLNITSLQQAGALVSAFNPVQNAIQRNTAAVQNNTAALKNSNGTNPNAPRLAPSTEYYTEY
jgi:hypothetical protein